MTLRCFSTSRTPRRIHDPSPVTFVRVAALLGFPFLHPPLRPRSHPLRRPPPALLPLRPPRRAPRQSPCGLSGRHYLAPMSAIQIP